MPAKIEGRSTKDIGIDCIGRPTYDNLDKFLDATNSAGFFEGGTITDSGSGQIDIASAKGVIRTTNSGVGNLVAFDIDATTNVSLTDNSMNYIYVDYNSGSPIWAVTTTYTDINLQSKIIVGRVYRLGNVLFIGNFGQDIQDSVLRDLYRLQTLRRLEWASGAMLSFTTATRQPTVTEGMFFANYEKIITAAFNASGADRFVAWYRNGSGGWLYVTALQDIDNTYWDDGTGTLNDLTTGDYGVHWFFILSDGSIHSVYGQANYGTLANARAATFPTTIPPALQGLGIFIGRIIIKKSATVCTEASSAFDYTFSGTTTVNHNELGGLQGGTVAEYYHATSAQQAWLAIEAAKNRQVLIYLGL
ncbi:MAG: hypothetical protein WC365_01500 [Candidatus Babeliales bacterium]|jgi:hypothetical protein